MAMAVQETAPDDDVCPICYGDHVLPYRAQCGHWFCGSCILQVWNYANAMQPCKCPMCSRRIKVLTPGIAVKQPDHINEDEIVKVVTAIERYNRLFVGGACGFIQRLRETPLFIKMMFREMADPSHVDGHICELRIFTIVLASLYVISPFNFNSKFVNIEFLGNLLAVVLVSIVKILGWYRNRRSTERARRLAVTEDLVQPQTN